MKVEKLGNDWFDVSNGNNETLDETAVALIMATCSSSYVMGMGRLRAFETEITKEMAKRMWEGEDISRDYPVGDNYKPKDIYMDYVFGRCTKTKIKLKGDKLEVMIDSRDRDSQKIFATTRQILNEHRKDTDGE